MLNGGFKEALEGSAYLPEDKSDAFDVLVDWAYSRSLRGLTTSEDKEKNRTTNWDPVEVFSMAEKFRLPELMNLVMDMLIEHHSNMCELPSINFTQRAYTRTSDGSSLQLCACSGIKFALEIDISDDNESEWPTSAIQQLCKENDTFTRDFIKSARPGSICQDPRNEPKCTFHTHDSCGYCPGRGVSGSRKRKIPEKGGSGSHLKSYKLARLDMEESESEDSEESI